MSLKIFFDNDREAPKGFTKLSSGQKLIDFMKSNTEAIDVLTIDYDMDEPDFTGYKAIKILINDYPQVFDKIKEIYIHSDNKQGRDNIWTDLIMAQDDGIIPEDLIIHSNYLQYNQMFLKDAKTGKKIF